MFEEGHNIIKAKDGEVLCIALWSASKYCDEFDSIISISLMDVLCWLLWQWYDVEWQTDRGAFAIVNEDLSFEIKVK